MFQSINQFIQWFNDSDIVVDPQHKQLSALLLADKTRAPERKQQQATGSISVIISDLKHSSAQPDEFKASTLGEAAYMEHL